MPTHQATGFWYPADAAASADDPAGACHAILWYGKHAPLYVSEMATLLGVSDDDLLAQVCDGGLLALPLGPEDMAFPVWQFRRHDAGHLLAGLREIIAVAPTDPWGVADLLTQRQATFDERIPLSALRGGANRGGRRLSSAAALLRALELVRAAYR